MEINDSKNSKMKLFISYSHEDEEYVEKFKKHISPLIQKYGIEEWSDRKIIPGKNWEKEIENNLSDADIILLFISSNFLASKSCQKEKDYAYELKKRKNIAVIPIILSSCGWKGDDKLVKSQALPKDGQPISTFSNQDDAWMNVYDGLKRVIDDLTYSKNLELKEKFIESLKSVDLLMKAHPQKENVYLEDIFVPPEFTVIDESKNYVNKIDFIDFMKNIFDYSKVVIAGESLSGKTTICKVIFKKLREMDLFPIYIKDENRLLGKLEDIISRFFNQEYNGDIKRVETAYIILIIDDFHLTKYKEKVISQILEKYDRVILVVDDISSLNIADNNLLSEFKYFYINEFKPSKRYELIKKWVYLKSDDTTKDISLYKEIDKKVQQIDDALGKTFGRGIMPSYPFYILSAIVTYETFAMPISQEITSQGYFYQAFVYLYLRKRGVKNDEVDIYVNFLTELAYYLFSMKKTNLNDGEINEFLKYYKNKFTLPIKEDQILRKIDYIFTYNNFNNYFFMYPYLYYFFVAKYLAENIEKTEIWEKIEHIINNIHVEENAYITVFLVYHSKNEKILDLIKSKAAKLFESYQPASLTKKETRFFDEHIGEIIEASLPPPENTPENEREKLLKIKDEIEEKFDKREEKYDEIESTLDADLRQAIKTGEVIGCILKSRIGSLEKKDLVDLIISGINIHLRILAFYFDLINHEETKNLLINLISKKVNEIIKEKEDILRDKDKIRHLAETIFWNLNFIIVFALIKKTIYSLGSDKITEIIDLVNQKSNTPSYFLIKQGIYMWYLKRLDLETISKEIKRSDFSELSSRIIKFMVIEYAYLHPINYKERHQIRQYLNIPPNRIPRNLTK